MGKRKKVEVTERLINGVLTPGKECTKCGEWKPLETGFHKDKKRKDGRCLICKECNKSIVRKYYEEKRKNNTSPQRIRVKITERQIDGVLVQGKECTKCGKWKPLETGFHINKRCLGGRQPKCKECSSSDRMKYYKEHKKNRKLLQSGQQKAKIRQQKAKIFKITEREVNGVLTLGKKCTKCGEWKPLDDYHRCNRGVGNRRAQCKDCYSEYTRKRYEQIRKLDLERNKKWRELNKEYRREYSRNWRKRNRDKVRIYKKIHGTKRRDKEKLLPNSLTTEQFNKILERFREGCALTGEINEIHFDHVIPVATGHGGTYHRNMIPLRADLNESKKDLNIFEWFSENRERFNLSEERFNRLIEYLATLNGLTPEEYRQFVYWCHENPRTEDEIPLDPRHSIEIWREATGLHFPLPAYAIENDNMSDNERSAS